MGLGIPPNLVPPQCRRCSIFISQRFCHKTRNCAIFKIKKFAVRKWTAEEERSHLALGVPEMLPGSVAFECIGDSNVFDGCYADTAEIGYDIHRGAIIVNSGFYNNPRMNLRKSTAIVHRGRHLRVAFCDFRGAAGCEKLYEGKGENVDWVGSTASGGAGMAADAARLFPQNPPCRPRQ